MPNRMFQSDLIEPAFKSSYLLPRSFFCFYLEVIFYWNSHPCHESLCYWYFFGFNVICWSVKADVTLPRSALLQQFLHWQYFLKYSAISSLLYSDRRLGHVTRSSLFQTLMLSALLYPAGPYHVVYHLKSMYSCTLRSSAIRRDYPWFIEVMTSLHQHWHILLFALHHFLSRPQPCLPETMPSSLLSAHSAVTDWCTG